uniref:Uncharacterized protein n=1 Tax=Meloidogyne incognita TaxID=6306 RepID=A0A914MGI5_MELIC
MTEPKSYGCPCCTEVFWRYVQIINPNKVVPICTYHFVMDTQCMHNFMRHSPNLIFL